jgi:hypothetical protein
MIPEEHTKLGPQLKYLVELIVGNGEQRTMMMKL